MPTLNTENLTDKTSLREFVARFVQHHSRNDWYRRELERYKKEREALIMLTDDEVHQQTETAWQGLEDDRKANLRKHQELRKKYESMLVKVEAWNPPTPQHKALKRRMIDELKLSIDHDCMENFYLNITPRKSPAQWFREAVERTTWHIDYYAGKMHAEELEAAANEQWINQLFDSIES